MTMVGKVIYGAGRLVGNTAEYSIALTGNVVSSIAERAGKKKLAINTKKYSEIASRVVGKTAKIAATVTAVVADTTINATINTAKYIAENVIQTDVRIYEQSENFYDEAKYIEVEYEVLENLK
ncbi:hypothetical protein [Clostridium sp.]